MRQRENRVGRSSDDPALRTEGELAEHDLNSFVGDLSGGVRVASVCFLTRRSVSGSDADEDALDDEIQSRSRRRDVRRRINHSALKRQGQRYARETHAIVRSSKVDCRAGDDRLRLGVGDGKQLEG